MAAATEVLKNAVESTGITAYASFYPGDDAEYCTINCVDMPDSFGDDRPAVARHLVQVHWFAPYGDNPTKRKRALCAALIQAGCTYPEITDASDENGMHFTFECEYLDGDVVEVTEYGEIQSDRP